VAQPARVVITRSNPISPDPRVEKTARALQEAGYIPTLLGWDRTGSLPAMEQVAGSTCFRLRIRAQYGSGARNLPALLRWQAGLLRWLIDHHDEIDIIHACDFDTVLPALWCRRRYGIRVVYDIFDFYADHLRGVPGWLKNMIRSADLRVVKRADAVILVDESRSAQIAGAKPRRSAVIYNSPEDVLDQIRHSSNEDTHPGLQPRLRIIYAGLLMVERGLLELISILPRHPDWRLDLAGFGGDEDRIVSAAKGTPNVGWHGRLPYASVLELSYRADVLLATYDPSVPNHRYASPNKVFEAMMLGKPVVVARDTNMDAIITAHQCGLVVPYGDAVSLESALQRLAEDPELRGELGRKGRIAYETTYSWAIMKERLLRLYREVENG
jgi:glycosyltransferase involved in cell wall biosynthesis